MTLSADFIKKNPRERSGSSTAGRYSYQKNWSLWLLLDCHESMSDYLIVFDYHEDIVVFDATINATNADFYQVKTKDKGMWTIKDLLKRDRKGKGNSIIGKMYHNVDKFGCSTKSVNLVSNASFKLALSQTEKDSSTFKVITASELGKDTQGKISEAIENEFEIKPVDLDNLLFFRVSALSLADQQTHTIGYLTSFLEKKFPERKFKPIPLYRALFSEIQRKTDADITLGEHVESLNCKSICRTEVEAHLSNVAIRGDFDTQWITIESHLKDAGLSYMQIRDLKQEWQKIEIHLTDHTNMPLQKIYLIAKKKLNDPSVKTSKDPLWAIVLRVKKAISENELIKQFSEDYCHAIILAALYE